jgi:hypothetical protein
MSTNERPRSAVISLAERASRQSPREGVLAVVGGALDEAVIDLALVLAERAPRSVHLLHLVEVPFALPLLAYARSMEAQGTDGPLERAVLRCGREMATAETLLCRGMGPALAEEVATRRCADLVIGAPSGGWWARWRRGLALSHIRAHAECRIYVVHTPPPPEVASPSTAAR